MYLFFDKFLIRYLIREFTVATALLTKLSFALCLDP